jgi:hypothetical protein
MSCAAAHLAGLATTALNPCALCLAERKQDVSFRVVPSDDVSLAQ